MISIITPVLNGSKFIQSNIESIEKLNIPYEHIIVDGGSTDGTIEIIKKYPKIILLNQSANTGLYGALDQGILHSRGKYIGWVNADDIIIPNGYEKLYKYTDLKNADFAYSHGFHHHVEEYRYKRFYARLFVRSLLRVGVFPFVQTSVIFSLSSYNKVGGFNYNKFRLIGDRDLFQRMSYDSELKFLFVPVFSSIFLRYKGSLLYRNLEQRKEEWKYCIKTKTNIFHRIIFHGSQVFRHIHWILSNKQI